MARELHEKHKFLVEISGNRVASAAFAKCSELSVAAAKIEYWEGGSDIPYKTAGRLTYKDVTLERGSSSSLEFANWFKSVSDAQQAVSRDGGFGRGAVFPSFKAEHATIIQLDRDNERLREWVLEQAFPLEYVAGEWDNGADDVVIEKLTLAFDKFYTIA